MMIQLAERDLTTKFGVFREHLYYDGQKESIAITMGDLEHAEDVPCRIHSACTAAHIFNSIECDCREQMEIAQAIIQQEGRGIIIWLDQEGRGHGHLAVMNVAKMAAEQGIPQTLAYKRLGYAADGRDFNPAAQILANLKVKSVALITNNPDKVEALKQAGIPVSSTRQAAISTEGNESLKAYYADKQAKGHNL